LLATPIPLRRHEPLERQQPHVKVYLQPNLNSGLNVNPVKARGEEDIASEPPPTPKGILKKV
jgi:hypothetical protein